MKTNTTTQTRVRNFDYHRTEVIVDYENRKVTIKLKYTDATTMLKFYAIAAGIFDALTKLAEAGLVSMYDVEMIIKEALKYAELGYTFFVAWVGVLLREELRQKGWTFELIEERIELTWKELS